MHAIWVTILLILFAPAAFSANALTGLVRNGSRGQPAIDDEVVLIRLDQEMRVEARAKTDAQGAFSLPILYPAKPHLLRVIHQNVNYDREVSGTDALSIEVFDASSSVPGITGTVEILRAGMRGKLLHVSDMYEIVNMSSPPVTQAGERAFEVYLPAKARIDSVLAAGPEKIGVMISATPVSGEPGRYSVNFPLRPGATKFAFNYDLPYSGHAAFQIKHVYPLQQLAVMIPPGMKFSSPWPGFQVLDAGNSRYQVRALNLVNAGDGPRFEFSGVAVLPPVRKQVKTQVSSPIASLLDSLRSNAVPTSLAHGNSAFAKHPSSGRSRTWEVVFGMCFVFAACAVIAWRKAKRCAVRQPVARLSETQHHRNVA
jgi:hypothetical protein